MYSLEELYDYLNFGIYGIIDSEFVEPDSAPSPTGRTLTEIYESIETKFGQVDATPDQVLETVKFFSTNPAAWGPIQGTMSNQGAVTYTPGTADQTVAAGYHNGSGKVVGDADLAAGNIKDGVEIFGISGDGANRDRKCFRCGCSGR